MGNPGDHIMRRNLIQLMGSRQVKSEILNRFFVKNNSIAKILIGSGGIFWILKIIPL